MKDGVGIFLWKISVALYLIANGVLGLSKRFLQKGDFWIIFNRLGFRGDALSIFVAVASVIAIIAGIAILLKMFNVTLPFLDILILVIAIIWAVYVIIEIIAWVKDGFGDPWGTLQRLAVHLMVLANLLIASGRG